MRIKFTFPKTEVMPQGRAICPFCGSKSIGNHQNIKRAVKHHKISEVFIHRRYCYGCGKTFRHYPLGVDHRHQTATLRAISVILYILGLSYDGVSAFLEALGQKICKATVWNNVQQAGKQAQHLRKACEEGKVKIAGIDTTKYKVYGKEVIIGFLSNILKGELVEIEVLPDEKAKTLEKVFGRLLEKLGVEVIVTDDAEEMEALRDELGAKRQLCLAHLRKAVVKRIKEFKKETKAKIGEANREEKENLKELEKDCEELEELVRKLPMDLAARFETIHQKYLFAPPPKRGEKANLEYRMRLFSNRLWSRSDDMVLFKEEEIDGTNNVTEREIGICGKIRYKTMRGFKSTASLKNYLKLNLYLRQTRECIDMHNLV